MLLSEFHYDYPSELIAQEAMEPRDASRMIVLDRSSQNFSHHTFRDFPDFFQNGDVLLLNNTKVLPARVWGKKKTGGKIEVLFVREIQTGPQDLRRGDATGGPPISASSAAMPKLGVRSGRTRSQLGNVWECLFKNIGNLKNDEEIYFEMGEKKIPAKYFSEGEKKYLEFPADFSVRDLMIQNGAAPLPPYIKRPEPRSADLERYQSVFAEKEGAIAAPTASLHFTPEVFEKLRAKGVEIHFITLHVGMGTFEPIRVENIEDHAMQTEYYEISPEVKEAILKAKQENRRVTAVGTTVMRAVESFFVSIDASWQTGPVAVASPGSPRPVGLRACGGAPASRHPFEATPCLETQLFITPGYKFKIIDRFLTNFHQPCSTPLLLTSAFAGKDFLFRAYQEAIEKKYRLFSYGDCMFIR